jgi:ribosomal protein L40E
LAEAGEEDRRQDGVPRGRSVIASKRRAEARGCWRCGAKARPLAISTACRRGQALTMLATAMQARGHLDVRTSELLGIFASWSARMTTWKA